MFKKQVIMVLAVVFMLVFVFAGCTSQEGGPAPSASPEENTGTPDSGQKDDVEKVTVTYWDENAGPSRTPIYDELIKRFEAENSGIEVEYVGVPWSSALDKFNVAIAANEVPDASGLAHTWVSPFVLKGAIIPLDKYFDKWEEKDKIAPVYIETIRGYTTVDDNLYMLPNNTNTAMIWYRSDWFEENGIKPFATWDEFYDAVEMLTDKEKNQFGFSIRGGAGSSYQIEEMMYAYSGITEYFDKNGNCTVNDPLNVEALKRFVSIYNKYTPESDITNGYKEMVAAFDTGVAGMIQHNLGSYGEHSETLEEGQFASLPFPVSVKGNRVAVTVTKGFGIYTESKVQDAAWELISFMSNEDSQSYWNMNTGTMPVHKDVLEHEWLNDYKHIQAAAEALAAENTTALAQPMYLPDFSSIHSNLLQPGFQAVLAGEKTVEEYLDEWAEAMNAAKKEYDENFK